MAIKKLDAFTFSLLTNCENGFVQIDRLVWKLSNFVIRAEFVKKRIKELCADGVLEREGHHSVTCSEIGRKRIKDTRKVRDGKSRLSKRAV